MEKSAGGKLTIKQTEFVKQYTVDFNGTQAAIRAGYSKKGASVQASELLAIPKVQLAVQCEIQKRNERTERTADEVRKFFWDVLDLDPADYMTIAEGGEVQAIALDQLPKGTRRMISKVKERRIIQESSDGKKLSMVSNLEYELPDKMKAGENLARIYGLFIDKLDAKVASEVTFINEFE